MIRLIFFVEKIAGPAIFSTGHPTGL